MVEAALEEVVSLVAAHLDVLQVYTGVLRGTCVCVCVGGWGERWGGGDGERWEGWGVGGRWGCTE